MNKPKKYEGTKNTYFVIKEYKEQGKYITIPFAEGGNKDTERQKEIRRMFNKHTFTYTDPDSTEDVIYELNEACDYGKRKIDMPLPDHTDDYLIEFDNGVVVHIQVADEYYGRGDSETSINVPGVVIDNETIADEEINLVINWLKDVFQ